MTISKMYGTAVYFLDFLQFPYYFKQGEIFSSVLFKTKKEVSTWLRMQSLI